VTVLWFCQGGLAGTNADFGKQVAKWGFRAPLRSGTHIIFTKANSGYGRYPNRDIMET